MKCKYCDEGAIFDEGDLYVEINEDYNIVVGFYCPECKKNNEYVINDGAKVKFHINFCPNCGVEL